MQAIYSYQHTTMHTGERMHWAVNSLVIRLAGYEVLFRLHGVCQHGSFVWLQYIKRLVAIA